MNLKRKPKSKSGRLLWSVRHYLILDVRFNVINDLPTDPEVLKTIDKLTDRIQRRLYREDKKKFVQSGMFNSFIVNFTLHGSDARMSTKVEATTKRKANALVKQRYGQKTKIISGML